MCSAKSGENVEKTFLKLTETLIAKTKPNVYGSSDTNYTRPGTSETTTLFEQRKKSASYGCCGY